MRRVLAPAFRCLLNSRRAYDNGSLFRVRPWVALGLHRGVPLVEVEVLAINLDFAALEVGWLSAQGELGWEECPLTIEVHDQSLAVLVAAIVVGDPGVRGPLHAVGGVRRQPAPRGEVDLGPIVDAPIGFWRSEE